MSIKDFTGKIKPFADALKAGLYDIKNNLKIKEDLFVALLIVFVGLASFGLGKLSSLEAQRTPISISNDESAAYGAILQNTTTNSSNKPTVQSMDSSTSTEQGIVFGSKSGTKYYYQWCSGAARVKDTNRVWFPSIAAAKSAGLTPAANCPGLI